MLRRFAVVLTALLVACSRSPVSDEVTIDIEKNDRVRVTAQTTFNDADVESSARIALVESARAAALRGTDPWALRFARVIAEAEEVTVQKHRGELDRVIRSVRISSRELQQVFSDTNITVQLLNGEGWSELAFYPGSSLRASREQQRHFENALTSWSGAVARYFVAIDHLYQHMSLNPQRAPHLFAALLNEKTGSADPILGEEEQPLVDAVNVAMEEIASRMDKVEEGGATFGEEADLIFNPFPARVTLHLPGEVISSEGFSKELVIEPVNLLDAVSALEGRWISPDPLAALLREQAPTSASLARQPRHSTRVVAPHAVADAIREQLERPKKYVVRWRG